MDKLIRTPESLKRPLQVQKEKQIEKALVQPTEVMPGCKLYKNVLFGCPSEIIKVLINKKLSMPDVFVLPPKFYQYGVVQAALEFPLYNFLFVEQGYSQGRRLIIVGDVDQIRRIREILEITLFGPNQKQYEEWGVDTEYASKWMKLSKFHRLPKGDGKATLDDMIDFVEYDSEGKVQIGDYQINRDQNHNFTILEGGEKYEVDIHFDRPQVAPLEIKSSNFQFDQCVLGVTALTSCTSGFDTSGYTSSLLLNLNGIVVAIDGSAWMKQHLVSIGINSDSIKGHVLTHIHDDHSSILDMIVNGHKTRLITTKAIYESFVLKAANFLNRPREKLKSMIVFKEVEPEKLFTYYGAEFDFWDTVHSIPTIGFEVTVNGRSVVYSGDTKWGTQLDEVVSNGLITREEAAKLNDVPRRDADLIFFDGGGGMIHPIPEEMDDKIDEEQKKKIVFTHTSKLPETLSSNFQIVEPGKNRTIIEQSRIGSQDILTAVNSPVFQGLSQEWLRVIVSNSDVINYPYNYTILKEGWPGGAFFIILSGTAVVAEARDEVVKLSSGDFFGEMSIMYDRPCCASVASLTPCTLLKVPKEIFLAVLHHSYIDGNANKVLYDRFRKIHHLRPFLLKIDAFKSLSVFLRNKIMESVNVEYYFKGEKVVCQGEDADKLYGIMIGEADVVVDVNGMKKKINSLKKGQLFGEIGLLGDGKRTADVVANSSKIQVFTIKKQFFDKLRNEAPLFTYELENLAGTRIDDLRMKVS